ncbi:hypothetical protein NFI95_15580 [Acetobacteraceae bacterium KSS8]|uniref:Uncharacterized protein n=1 Tax=Endosaccharibacter trunci TaxID=2812733 RepID=A0ABT1WAE5_9PROT|nr:hypothetical protein [Acetobacteraceae bacterium KSS8]
MAQGNPFTIGRDCQVVFLYNGGRIDLPKVTLFTSSPEYKTVRSDPLNDDPTEINTPSGHRLRIEVDRFGAVVDDLFVSIESAFWNAGTIGSGTVYAYIAEVDGSLSTYEYTKVSPKLTNGGQYQQENKVTQTIEGFASRKNKL